MAKKAYVWDGTAWQEITSDSSIPVATTSNTGIVQLVDSVASTSTVNAAVPNSVKTAYDQAVTATTNAATAQAAAVAAQSTADGKPSVSTTAPAATAATAAVGTGTTAARADHVHEGVPATRTLTGTAPITVGGVSGTGQALSANLTVAATAATTSAAGVVQLTDSAQSTSITTAATPNAVLQSMKYYQASIYNSTTRMGNLPAWYTISTTQTAISGRVEHVKIIPERNFTVSNLSFIGSGAGSGLTLVRFGIYTRSGTTFTLVARTAADATIFASSVARFTRALDTTGGYPATYDFVAGNEYWVSMIVVGTTMPTFVIAPSASQAAYTATGAYVYTQTGQTDLPATSTGTISSGRWYCEVS